MAFTHARLPNLWSESRWAPASQCVDPFVQYIASVPIPQTSNRRNMAKRNRGDSFRASPTACGVGRLGCGTKGYVIHLFRAAQSVGLCPLR
jgi:hypothetical protein